jgi:SAM-dependent methyltransferase
MNRRAKILSGLNLQAMKGAEIGALTRPLVRRTDGRVIYVDHADTETLRQKYAADPQVNQAAFVDVGGVWGDNTLLEALGTPVDYIVASHVIEHVPDLVTWLGELVSALKPGGEIRLAVPDKRFTFDFRRKETAMADVLPAYESRARRPMPAQVEDFVMNMTPVLPVTRWIGKGDDAPRQFTPEQARDVARAAAANDEYNDVHCWVFTPASFARLMRDLVRANLIAVECTMFFDTAPGQLEFIVGMKPGNNAGTWSAMEARCIDRQHSPLIRLHPGILRSNAAAAFPAVASIVKGLIRR